MDGGREVVTLQLGNYANYVGAHFWNIEDDSTAMALEASDDGGTVVPMVLHSCLSRGPTGFDRPRLLAVDLHGALGCALSDSRDDDDEYGRAHCMLSPSALAVRSREATATLAWRGGVQRHRADRVERHAYQRQLEEEEKIMESMDGMVKSVNSKDGLVMH